MLQIHRPKGVDQQVTHAVQRSALESQAKLEVTGGARRRIAPFVVAAAAALLVGLWAGLARMGWSLPAGDGDLPLRHGGLMVAGFVATVIAVERAIAIGRPFAFLAPALGGATAVALVIGAPLTAAAALATATGAAYSLNVGVLLARHRRLPFVLLSAGGLALIAAGAVWWAGETLPRVLPWWMAFLVLTIGAERLEIIRFQRFTRVGIVSGSASLGLLLAGPPVALVSLNIGARLLGAGLVAGAIWLARRDVARRTVRGDRLARFAATGVLTAYAWLAATGVILLVRGLGPGFGYDAAVHTFFIGFVFGAIIAHAPIIGPSISGLRFGYTRLLYAPLAILDGALVVRVVADLVEGSEVRRWAGLAQAVAILMFVGTVVVSVMLGRRGDRRSPAGR